MMMRAASILTHWFGPPASGSDDVARAHGRIGEDDASSPRSSGSVTEDDAAIVERIRGGDRDAFDRLFHRYYARLWVYARRRSTSDDAASDVVQDVFAALWSTHERWRVRISIKAYLFGAVQRRVLHLRRHESVVGRAEAESVAAGVPLGLGASPIAADVLAEAGERSAAIARAVLALPERQRIALALWWRDEMTSSEIAEVLRVSPQAVRKLLGKAWEHLRTTLSVILD
jgi:RNA polymerase sigma-70 factor (ECF subfamily)